MDNLTKTQRSFNMSRIRSKWTKPETQLHNLLKNNNIKHKMHPKIFSKFGNPDIVLKNKKTAIFVHGCFWHKCKEHFRMPKSNHQYWENKFKRNIKRDFTSINALRKYGWEVKIIWEHDLKKEVLTPIQKILNNFKYKY